jgi:hypothetical protein
MVGLQRMFGHASEQDNTLKEFTRSAAEPDNLSPPTYGTDAGHFQTSGYSHDVTTNTITFSPPTIQREAETASEPAPASESAPAPSEPAPESSPATSVTSAPAAAGAGAAAAAGAAKELNVDELVNNIYDTLAARLRGELWLDRERAGVLMDLGR